MGWGDSLQSTVLRSSTPLKTISIQSIDRDPRAGSIGTGIASTLWGRLGLSDGALNGGTPCTYESE